MYENERAYRSAKRPIVVITSNNEKELPDAFYAVVFTTSFLMQRQCKIVDAFPDIKKELVKTPWKIFFDVRKVPGLKKKPLPLMIDWLKLLMAVSSPPKYSRSTTRHRRFRHFTVHWSERAGCNFVAASGVYESSSILSR